jgi:hypothetical protein
MSESLERQTTFGFLSAIESAEHGFFGGYLVISPAGRPLEFHCTAPVFPSRAQRILYGATLASYLLGEQIAGSLLAAGKLTPRLILTDLADFGLPWQKGAAPLVLVRPNTAQRSSSVLGEPMGDNLDASSCGSVAAYGDHPSWGDPFTMQDCLLQLPAGFESEHDKIVGLLDSLRQRVDLLEPFERIHEAIREAQRIGARSQESHGHAA